MGPGQRIVPTRRFERTHLVTGETRGSGPLTAQHPVVLWVRTEILPLLVETLAPTAVLVFDPPDRPAAVGTSPPGLLVVSVRFQGVDMRERLALVHGLLSDASPVRPLCLTPGEFELAAGVPGPVLAAARTGIELI